MFIFLKCRYRLLDRFSQSNPKDYRCCYASNARTPNFFKLTNFFFFFERGVHEEKLYRFPNFLAFLLKILISNVITIKFGNLFQIFTELLNVDH